MSNLTTYNGIPVFEVGYTDFTLIIDARENNKRLLSKTYYQKRYRNTIKKKESLSSTYYLKV